jgi:hypothetical protein
MDWNEIPNDPRHLGVPSIVSKMISEPMVRSVKTMHLSWVMISTISKQAKTTFPLSHVTYEYYQLRPKRFLSLWYIWCKPCTYLAPTLKMSPNGSKRDSTWPTSPMSFIRCVQNYFWAYGMFGANRAPILCQDWHSIQMDQNKLPIEPRHQGVPSGLSERIYEPKVCLAQIVHLSCIQTNWNEIPHDLRY